MKAIGLILVIFGVLLCLSCWGAIFGIPMIVFGAIAITSKC